MSETEITEVEELAARAVERAMFWDGYINLLVQLRHEGARKAVRRATSALMPTSKDGPDCQLREGLQQAIDAALLLQQRELAECFMLSGVGGKRAEEYARARGQDILGPHLKYAVDTGYAPTFWWSDSDG